MGWWNQTEEGTSFAASDELKWGDGPADVMDDAIEQITAQFQSAFGRAPTRQEFEAGFKFSLYAALEQ